MGLVINRVQDIQRDNAINVNKQLAQAASKEITEFITSQYDILKQIEIVYVQKDIGADAEASLVERFLFQNDSFTDITILDAHGQEKIRKNLLQFYTKDNLQNRSLSTEFTIIKQNRYYFSPFSITNGKPTFTIGIPIIGIDGSFQGALLAVVDARLMESVVKKISVVEKKGKAYIVNESGVVIAHPDVTNVLSQNNFSHYPPVKEIVYRNAAVKPLDIYTNENNQQVLGTGFPITIPYNALANPGIQTKWFIIIEQPAAVLLDQVAVITRYALITVSFVLIITIILSLLFAARIVRPIELVHAASQRIGKGNLTQHITVHTNDEIEDLANGVNTMADNLREAFRKLEQDRNIISVEKNKLEVTLTSIVDAIIAIDGEKKIIVFNAAAERLTGVKSIDALGNRIDTIIKVFQKEVELRPDEYCPVTSLTGDQVGFIKNDLRIQSQTGNKAVVNLTVGHIKEDADVKQGYILTLHDITKEKELEQMKLDFVSMAAHELRTPLTSLKGYLSFFDNPQFSETERKEFLSRINISTERLTSLVENILNVSKIEKGVMTIDLKPTDWTGTLKDIIVELTNRATERNIGIQFREPEHPLPRVLVDRLRIYEVVINLLGNAINYTKPGGQIQVWTEEKDGKVITHIKDNGQGIPREAIPHLFTKFFRVSGVLEQGSKGTGLGLYIAKAIVENHNGEIWVESEMDIGSTFSFSLPAEADETSQS
jgi:PAS domain S-box-containing protein